MMLGMDNPMAPRADGRDPGHFPGGGPPPYGMPPTSVSSGPGTGNGMPPFPGQYPHYGHYPPPPGGAFPWNMNFVPTHGAAPAGGAGGGQMLPPEMAGVYDPTPVSPPPQRERFSYTRYQLELMNGIYTSIRYPNSMQKQLIAKRVGITRDQVKIWFQNRRRKDVVEKNTGKKALTKPLSGSDSDDLDGVKMVPVPILNGMIQELMKYENDPKGKKAAEALKKAEKEAKGGGKKRKAEDVIEKEDHVVPPKNQALELNTDGLLLQISPVFSSPLSSAERHNTSAPSTTSMSSPEALQETNSPLNCNSNSNLSLPPVAGPRATEVPSNEQLDMESPPNVTAPAPPGYCGTNTMTRSVSEDSISEINNSNAEVDTSLANTSQHSQHSESSQDFVPPNKMAPPASLPRPNLPPLSVHIPGAEKSNAVTNGSPYHSTQGLVGMAPWHGGSKPTTEYPQYARDNPYMSCPSQAPHLKSPVSEQEALAFSYAQNRLAEKGQDMPWHLPQCNTDKGDPSKVFPFPIMAEPPQFLPGMGNAFPPNGQGHTAPYLDPYQQPSVITSYNNPYFNYDNWANQQQEDKQAKATS